MGDIFLARLATLQTAVGEALPAHPITPPSSPTKVATKHVYAREHPGKKRGIVPDDNQGQGRGRRHAPKAKRVRLKDVSARVPRCGPQGWAATAEGDYRKEFTTEEEQAEATTSAVRESGRQRSSDKSTSKRMLTPPPEAQQLRARDTRTEKAAVVDLGGEDDEPLDRSCMPTHTTTTPPPAVTPRAAVNERPVSGRLPATPSQPRQRNEGGDRGSVERGGGGGVVAEARAVGAEAAGAAGVGGSGTVAPIATAREEAAVAATTREEARGEKKGDREGGEPGSSQVHRGVMTKDLIDRAVLWVDDKAFWTTGEGQRLYNIVHDTKEYFVAIASGLPPPAVPRSVVLPKSSTRVGRIADQSELQQAISRVADCFRLLLAACMWIMRMAGDDPRNHYKAFYFANLVAKPFKPTLVASMHHSFYHRRTVVRAAKVITERLGKANATFGQYPDYIPQWAPCGIGFRHDASITGPEDAKKLDWLGSGPPDDENNNDEKDDA
ncbi:hypothetical protein CBR_g72650 [Chara braunii]|uniref:Uncharacterized protein n=1 Tax=Chara braunii TaxID=69332 RepID=A0A388KA12_CHABU|nr:hypothetical protein CBR_g72650 [Chara braunii]|eukprot:GBG66895.1 hypothetical protein CBR_g72650 [Chara braunii]